MNNERIIFLGIINSIEEFYELTGKNSVELELSEEQEIYNDKQIIITKEEIKKYFGEYKNIKELRQKAIEYFAKNIQGKVFNIDKFKNIKITRKARNKYESFSADERKLLIVPKLLKILKTSAYKHSELPYKTRKDKIIKFHYFTNEVMVKKILYKIYITIGEDSKGNLFYDLDENKKP